ncbi:MAG TPA: hypothetical protein VJR26_13435 [Candidatus Acidoferrales bacterium]|nr:hypothetical protein [Candidatus Acidoferrales bacterium]
MRDPLEPKYIQDDDPLLWRFAMPLKGLYHPMGFPVEITTNSEDVLSAAEHHWGAFTKMFDERPIELRIGVLETGGGLQLVEPVLRGHGDLMMKVGTMDDFAVCDMKKGVAFAWISAATARNHAYVHTHYIEGTAFWALNTTYLTPVHAACVSLNGKGLLFCGESEAGKSSLAYACVRSGWTFITDDLSEIVRSWETTSVLGNPHRFRLRESAVTLFPELRDHPITLRANGERAIELVTARDPRFVTAPYSRVDYILFLNRQNAGRASLAPFSKQKAMRWFEQVLCVGDQTTRDSQAATLRRLLAAEILEFRYSDMDAAVEELKLLVGAIEHPVRAKTFSVGYQENG